MSDIDIEFGLKIEADEVSNDLGGGNSSKGVAGGTIVNDDSSKKDQMRRQHYTNINIYSEHASANIKIYYLFA